MSLLKTVANSMPDQKMHETLIKKADQLLKIKQVR